MRKRNKVYNRPELSVVELGVTQMMAQSMNSKDIGIDFGGKTSAHSDISEADANGNKGWDLW